MFLKNKSLSAIVSNQDFINYVIIKTLTCSIFMHFNNFYKFFFFYKQKISKDSSGIYYQNNKEKLQKSS